MTSTPLIMKAREIAGRASDGRWWILGEDEGPDRVPYLEISSGECGTKDFVSICHVQPDMNEDNEFVLTEANHATAAFIAWSRTGVLELADEIERLEVNRESMIETQQESYDQIKRLTEALEFYANSGNCTYEGIFMTPYVDDKLPEGKGRRDYGDIARAALKNGEQKV